ncbi:MAG: GNAT family N-acetyltransferase [Deltaproteobacteria bacterium]|nr:GNAT family N-acetyltransferase [Deltaproteobacteria bacterium]
MNAPAQLHASTLSRIDEVSAEEWDALLAPDDPPVLRWHWLEAMEHSGTVRPARGWRPCHLILRRGGDLVAAMPLYLRDDTWGEFVWSDPVEEACEQIGFAFTPRAVSTVPATPAAGRRLLTHPDLDRLTGMQLLTRTLLQFMEARGLASLNVHFCADDEVTLLREAGFIERNQWQYWWRSTGETDFEGFLARLEGKTRRSIRRERRRLREAGVEIRMVPGDEAPDSWFAEAARLYGLTAQRHDEGDQLIEPGFFTRIGEGPLRSQVRFSVGLEAGELVGLAFELQGETGLFGRTWGLSKEVPYLHFEAAYYNSIEYAISQGLTRFEPGHGGEFKYKRGFQPTQVTSMHRFASPRLHAAVAAWAAREREWVEERLEERLASSVLKELAPG